MIAAADDYVRVFRACGRVVLMEVREDGSAGEEWAIPEDEATDDYVLERREMFEDLVRYKQGRKPSLGVVR